MNNNKMLERVEEFNNILVERNEEFRIKANECFKNGGNKIGYSLFKEGRNCAPTVYFEALEDVWENSEAVVERLVEMYQRHNIGDICIEDMMSRDYILAHVQPKVISNKNLEAVVNRGMVHKEFLDLIVLYYVPVEALTDENGTASYTIQEQVLKMTGIEIEELHERALCNLDEVIDVRSMSSVIADMMGLDESEFEEMAPSGDMEMWVISNKNKYYGAASILSAKALEILEEKFGEEFVLLSSSIHELIAVPMGDRDAYTTMIQEVNDSEVSPEDVLNDHPYKCCNGEVSIY